MSEKLSVSERIRYARHLNIPEFGEAGQIKMKSASLLVVGAGGLGSASASYLAAAGIGRIGIVDSDTVELSNLQRQIMHGMSTIGKEKVLSAKRRLGDINPSVRVHTYNTRLYEENVEDIIGEYPIIVDATDNFESRYIINRACVKMKRTFIYGAVFQFYGQLSVFPAGEGPCFQCVFRKMPSEDYIRASQGVGVVGALPGVIGSMQALEAIKVIVGVGTPAVGRLLLFDGLEASCQEIKVEKDPDCPVCSKQ